MADKNWYQRPQAEFAVASANFAARLVAEAAELNVSPDQAADFGLLNTALQSAFTAAITPETRTGADKGTSLIDRLLPPGPRRLRLPQP